MSNYTPGTDFSVKDALVSGDPEKLILGADFDVEFVAIQTAVATKEDTANKGAASGYASLDSGTKVPAAQIPDATTTAVGGLEIATQAEAVAVTADTKIITPLKVAQVLAAPPAIGGTTPAAATFTTVTATTVAGTNVTLGGTAVVPESRTITAGTGLSGGGTLAANRTVSLDFSGVTAIDMASIAATDGIVIDDSGVLKRMAFRSMGTRTQASSTKTLASDDANCLFVNTGASEHTFTIPLHGTLPYHVGTEFAFTCQSTGKIAIAPTGGVTLVSLNSFRDVKASGGGAYLVKTATDTWSLLGDLEA